MALNIPTHIFGLWTGDNPMNANRRRGWESFGVTGLEPVLVTSDTLERWIIPDEPLHPAYPLLSFVHRADYLRSYLMFHHGGGYADIKPQTGSWLPAVERLARSPRLIAAGYREIRGGAAVATDGRIEGHHWLLSRPVSDLTAKAAEYWVRALRPILIGNCAYYFKPRSPFARRWLDANHARLDRLLLALKDNPPADPRDRAGSESGYPMPWTTLHGESFSLLAMLYAARIDRGLPPPEFTNYS